jgi:hypothetical protein
MLEPYDIIEVDKAKKSIAQTVMDIAMEPEKWESLRFQPESDRGFFIKL